MVGILGWSTYDFFLNRDFIFQLIKINFAHSPERATEFLPDEWIPGKMVAFSSAILLSVFMLPLSSSRLMNLFRCLDKYLCRFPYRQYSAISKSSSAKSKRIVSRWTSQMNKTSHYTDTGTSALSIALLKKIVQVFVCRLCLLFFLNYGVLTRSFVIFL